MPPTGMPVREKVCDSRGVVLNARTEDISATTGATRHSGRVNPIRHHRTLFVSDVHFGSRGCKADALIDFLEHNTSDTLYLVGDIIDGWQLKRGWYWTDAQTRAFNLILARAKSGTKVIYVPGNHDEMFRAYCGLQAGGIDLRHEDVHETADGRRMLILHGDIFDSVVMRAKAIAKAGAHVYEAVIVLNRVVNGARQRMGLPYWSLAAYLKSKVKNAGPSIDKFERAAAAEAKRRGFDGIVCGHIHTAALKLIDGVLYCNDGDWMESCTAMVEDDQGRFSLLQWSGAEVAHGVYPHEAVPAAA